ncbi:alpha amylase, all-beta domain protein [Oesophagostomum dentatum]|uniref:alpha-amylase n=1 Tax=Oesophagostomum dentatum TaxID=61180 RepID=A0A0B1TDD2_OESDE|nr:alpha amylase, all-beta domain protein [Oesophagostomum dentatum]
MKKILKLLISFRHAKALQIFGSNKRPFVVHEVIDRGGEAVKCAEYTGIGRYTNFNYGPVVSEAVRGHLSWHKLQSLKEGYAYGNHADNDVLNFIDNHDNQRGGDVLNYKDGDAYKKAVAFMLAWSYGYPRVMSSYYFDNNDQGPPREGSYNVNYYSSAAMWNKGNPPLLQTKSPSFNQDLTCNPSSGWVCEHRWPITREMAKFRSIVSGTPASKIMTGYKQLAFDRGGRGFFAINDYEQPWRRYFFTALPSGQYCDVWSGSLKDGRCTGRTINVNNGNQKLVLTC